MVNQNRTILGFTRPRTYRDVVDLLVTYNARSHARRPQGVAAVTASGRVPRLVARFASASWPPWPLVSSGPLASGYSGSGEIREIAHDEITKSPWSAAWFGA